MQHRLLIKALLAAAGAACIPLSAVAQTAPTMTVCNKAMATIHIAFATHVDGAYTTSGWWAVPRAACQPADFKQEGDTLYFAADSDSYKVPQGNAVDHWGFQVELYVGQNRTARFSYTSADKNRSGAMVEKFQTNELTGPLEKMTDITVNLEVGHSSVSFTSRP
jgi:hypothetical protein